MDYGSMMAPGGQAPQPVSAPTAQQPGGGPQEPQDPTQYSSAVCAQALDKLAEEFESMGDEASALKVRKMALEVKRIRIDRQKKLAQGYRDVQATVAQAAM